MVWHRLVTIDQYNSRLPFYNHITGQSMYNLHISLGIDLKEFMLKVHNPLRLNKFQKALCNNIRSCSDTGQWVQIKWTMGCLGALLHFCNFSFGDDSGAGDAMMGSHCFFCPHHRQRDVIRQISMREGKIFITSVICFVPTTIFIMFIVSSFKVASTSKLDNRGE